MKSNSSAECDLMLGSFQRHLDGTLPPNEAAAMNRHLAACPYCKAELEVQQQVTSMLGAAYEGKKISPTFERGAQRHLETWSSSAMPVVSADAKTGSSRFPPVRQSLVELQALQGEAQAEEKRSWMQRFSAAPWWLVSGALHVLVILLAGLISMAIELPKVDESVVMVTELVRREPLNVEPEKLENKAVEALNSNHDTPPTDPTSKEASNIIVPPDILKQAELGDHFETINPDRPDTQSAFGNPDAQMFHSTRGNDEPPGGGGIGGTGLDELIGVGGLGSPGTGGGWGGGNGTGTGIGDGAGHGSFGNRTGGGRRLMVMRKGGSQKTEDAVALGLEWLAYHQEADGHWDVKKYEGGAKADAGITALALLAFLGAGHSERVGKYRDNVKRAVSWIISQQGADGSIGKNFAEHWHPGYAYHHAMCGLALAEAAGMGNIAATRDAAQKAVDYSCEVHQMGEGSQKLGWRYTPKSEGDASASGWFVMQLKSAKIAGLKVNPASFEGALAFYDSLEDKSETNGYGGGKFSYTRKGANVQGDSRILVNPTAIGMLCNMFLGRKPAELAGGAEYLCENLPKWDATCGKGIWDRPFPLYYTYYGSLAMFQIGGDHWKKWNKAILEMVPPHQCKDGDKAGSWDPLGGNDCEMGGRVYATAVCVLTLEVYYRYVQVNGNN